MTLKYNILAAAALAAAVFLSCQKEIQENAPMQEMTKVSLASSKPDYLSFPDTKTHWNGSTVLWSAGDRISVCLTENEAWKDVIYASEAITESASRAIFDFSVSSDLNGKLQFYTVFPSSAVSGFAGESKVNVTIPSVQTPTASSFDPAADLMTGKSVRKYDGIPQESVPVLWNRLVAHADLTLTGLPFDSSESVKSVDFKVQDGAALTGGFLLDLSAGTMEPTQNVADNVLMMADELERAQDGSLRAWASFMPLTVTSLTVTLTTDKNVYVKKVPTCSLAFRKNARSYLTVDMTSATKDLLPDEKEKLNALVNPRVFEALDLDRSGLASVKTLYSEGELYKAAVALLEYWKTGRTVTNPDVDLAQTAYSSADKEKADNALKENGYRLYVNNYDYYSFSDGNGGINWGFSLPNETQFNIQKHRHQWTLPQAKVYWGTKDEKYVQSYMEVYSSWLAAHPCPFLTNGSYTISASDPLKDMWTDLQATSRIMDQIDILDYYVQSESLTPQFLTHFLAAFADAVECVRANPYHEQLSNHRVYEIQAVFAAGMMMPEFKNSGVWLEEASDDITSQIGVQFADDGVLVEMDPGYHIPMVSIFYDINRIADANGKSDLFPSDYTLSLQKAVTFVRDLAYPDYSLEDFNDVRSSSWTKSTLTKNFVKYYDMFPEDKTLQYWATGHTEGEPPTETLSLYKTTGWYMLRDGWTKNSSMMILKNNYNKRDNGGVWWHCQPDNGTVSLYHKGRHFLPDAGAYTYTNGTDREAYRATARHNTLTLDGATIADSGMLGTFKNSAQTNVYDMVHTSNQSYGALRHERAVFRVKDGFFVIVDFGIGSATGSVELNWHFCPGDMVYSQDAKSYSCRTDFSDGNNMMFKTFCFNGTVSSPDFTGTTGTSYTSNAIGVRQERPCCKIAVQKTEKDTPVRFITVIHPFSGASQIPEISAVFNSAAKVTVTVSGKEYVLSL